MILREKSICLAVLCTGLFVSACSGVSTPDPNSYQQSIGAERRSQSQSIATQDSAAERQQQAIADQQRATATARSMSTTLGTSQPRTDIYSSRLPRIGTSKTNYLTALVAPIALFFAFEFLSSKGKSWMNAFRFLTPSPASPRAGVAASPNSYPNNNMNPNTRNARTINSPTPAAANSSLRLSNAPLPQNGYFQQLSIPALSALSFSVPRYTTSNSSDPTTSFKQNSVDESCDIGTNFNNFRSEIDGIILASQSPTVSANQQTLLWQRGSNRYGY